MPYQIQIEVNTTELFKGLEKIEGAEAFKYNFLIEAKALIASRMVRNAPRRTGRLRGSIVSENTPEGFIVYPKAPYAICVDRGTGLWNLRRPHKIFPKKAKVLRFQADGKTVFARWTRGQKPQWFVERTNKETEGPIRVLASEMMVRHFRV